MAILPAAVLMTLAAWQIVSFNHYHGMPDYRQIIFLALAFILGFTALFYWDTGTPARKYVKEQLDLVRPSLIGASCVLMGGIHFISVLGDEPVYVQMAYAIIIIAYFEVASMSIRFREHYSGEIPEVTRGTLNRLMAILAGRLGMVFALSIVMLYLSLLVIVGFTDPATVAVLAAIMILALSFMTLVRRL